MKKTVILDTVALTPQLLGKHTPRLSRFVQQGSMATIQPALPAVTCSAQTTYLTGQLPNQHGIVGNGWYFRDECEVKFWKQSNTLVTAEKIWDLAKKRDKNFTCANLFWWYNMYSSVDYAITPRPMYLADGRKIPDIYTKPTAMRDEIQKDLGQFPLFHFWGPAASIRSTQWIADAAQWTEKKYDPTLTLIYLPHLDYCLQKYGPEQNAIGKDIQELDTVCGELIDFYETQGAQVIVLSEYGITSVNQPIHINRMLREHGFVTVRTEQGKELLDAGASDAFAVADHQIAHVYLNNPNRRKELETLLKKITGIAEVLDEKGKKKYGLHHPRAGDFILIAKKTAWFTYYYWLDDTRAPDFARTVDIHRKPGYDPVELFINPQIPLAKLKIAATLVKKQLGFRALMDVIPLDGSLVRGSHGNNFLSSSERPVFITKQKKLLKNKTINATDVFDVILKHLDL